MTTGRCLSCGETWPETRTDSASCPRCGAAAEPGRKVAVLADSSRPFRELLAQSLQERGFDLLLFESTTGLIEEIRSSRPDLMAMNVMLRGEVTLPVLEAIRADASIRTTPVLLIGAIFRPERFRSRPHQLYGADGYLDEEMGRSEISSAIRSVLGETVSASHGI